MVTSFVFIKAAVLPKCAGCAVTVVEAAELVSQPSMTSLSITPSFITSSRGNVMVRMEGHNFSNVKSESHGLKKRWVCSRANGCRASIITIGSMIVKYRKHHQFVTSNRGNQMIQIGRYNFSLHKGSTGVKKRWVCSRWAKGCRVALITLEDVIIKISNEHNH
ncbi:hypothetical protein KGM_208247 [Danaus plexippus plexippus]|uniref:FLYWCH-type domain-containing protein n=1 Tax=Danaus plexippus plexippus TaxID=278856 RepID=A0A212FGY2_DANPL|nr:hypothetical protein KGM_208247 [Danaus plexippus plexippus]